MRKAVIFVLVLILISFLAVMGYFLQEGRQTLLTDPYKAVSANACIVIETTDLSNFFNSVSSDKGLFGEFDKIKELGSFRGRIKFLSGLMNRPGFKRIINGNHAVLSFHLSVNGKLQTLLSMTIPPEIRTRQLRGMLVSSGISKIISRKQFGNDILGLPYVYENISDTAWISGVSGLLICSSSWNLIKDAILQTGSATDIRDTPGFSRILQASGKNEDRIFVVFGNLGKAIRPLFSAGSGSLAEKTGRLADCAEGDISMNDNGIVLNGYAQCTDSADLFYMHLQGTAGVLHTCKILPSSTALFETIITEKINFSQTGQKPLSSKTSALASKLSGFIGKEITKAYIDIKGRSLNENTLIIYELKNRVYAEKILLDEFEPEMNKNNVLFFRPDDQTNIPVYLTPYKRFSFAIKPGFEGIPDDSCFAFYDNYLITGSSFITVSKLLYDNILNKTLSNDLSYRDFESTLPTVAGYFFYCVPWRLTDYLFSTVNEKTAEGLKSNSKSLDKIEAIGYQLTSSNNMLYNSLSVRFREEGRQESVTEWETLLDTVAAIKPFFFTNHETGAKEIFIQDMNNNAYLINEAGRVLWKVPLKERIAGTVYMIDYYRNGKYQILFSGKNYLHLLDRNGNYVERYPVKLRSPATSSLALFDYDNNKNYRILIAGEDKNIYAYDKSGNLVKGWNRFRTSGTVSSELYWFRVSGKDYIVFADETSVYFIDRTGKTRLILREPVTKARNSAIRMIPGRDPSVVCSSPDGTVQQIYFDGTVRKFSLLKLSDSHCFDVFDVNGDGFGEYIFIDKGILYLYDHNRSEMFSREFGSKELDGPINFIFSGSERKIGVFDADKNLIYLMDGKGTVMSGFPLKGASMFSVGKLSEQNGWHLFVGGTDRFLYNYKLDTEIK